MSIINVENIWKTFGNYNAVSDISFKVEPGRIFGMLGPNGAGKTTTIRMITNILFPDKGKIWIKGEIAGPIHQNIIAYLPEERGLYKKLKVIEQLIYFAQLKGVSKHTAIEKAKYWLAKMGASGWENKKIQELSKGMQQKVQFISTMLHDPEIIILDEPFSGFDPINTELLKSVILEMKNAGKTIILSTHVMEQVEQMCDDILLINKGISILNGDMRNIKKSYGRDTILIEFDGDDSFIENLPKNKILSRTLNRIEFKLEDNTISSKAILAIASDKAEIVKFEKVEPSLHEIFIEVVGKENMKKEQAIEA